MNNAGLRPGICRFGLFNLAGLRATGDAMSAIQRWLVALALVAVAVTVCFLWLDRPLAELAHALVEARGHHLVRAADPYSRSAHPGGGDRLRRTRPSSRSPAGRCRPLAESGRRSAA